MPRPSRAASIAECQHLLPQGSELVALLGCAGLLIVGWSSLLVPSAHPLDRGRLRPDRRRIGIFFFVNALGYIGGSMGGGSPDRAVRRRAVLTLVDGPARRWAGRAGHCCRPGSSCCSPRFPFGLGGGALDGGVNGLFLDLYPESRGRALNLLHLSFSVGALASPLARRPAGRGRRGLAGDHPRRRPWPRSRWRSLFALIEVPSGAPRAAIPRPALARIGSAWPLIALAVAHRLLRRLGGRRVELAGALPRYGDGRHGDHGAGPVLGLPRAGASRQRALERPVRPCPLRGDRGDRQLAALAGAVVAPSLELSIVLFGAAGFAFGPVFPLIMAVGGDRYPTRSAAVSGFLSGMAVIGSIAYPPIMGFLSVTVGLARR